MTLTKMELKKGGHPLDINLKKKQVGELILKLMILAFLTTLFLINPNISAWCC